MADIYVGYLWRIFMKIKYGNDLIEISKSKGLKIWEIATQYESGRTGKSSDDIFKGMQACLIVMREALQSAMSGDPHIHGKIIKQDSKKIFDHIKTSTPVSGEVMAKAIGYALGMMEVNASMGRIVAAPTAGSCGILPAVLFSLQNTHNLDDKKLTEGLLTASAIGVVIAKNASLSGAEGGCQAEVGSAAAMAAAAVVEMLGGSTEQALHSSAIAIKNLMGLVCDPIAGLVEAPCTKRNAMGTANALISAEMALAGIESVIPFDEVVVAMHNVGKMLPCSLRETADGGVAVTPTGLRIKHEIFG